MECLTGMSLVVCVWPSNVYIQLQQILIGGKTIQLPALRNQENRQVRFLDTVLKTVIYSSKNRECVKVLSLSQNKRFTYPKYTKACIEISYTQSHALI